jgi:hypothetical protein
MKLSKGNLSGRHKLALGLLFAVPLVIVIGKCSILPTSDFLSRIFSLADIPEKMHRRVAYILFVPFGATLVVFFRLALGIRLLGPFRSILIAVAFQITGILPGMIFLVTVVGIVVYVRPRITAIRLPYFARVSVILSAVSSIMIIALLSSSWFDSDSLRKMVYFPIIVLSLMGDGFARTLSKEGFTSAMWRGTMTVLVALLITLLTQINGFRNLFLNYPELLIVEIACIVVIAEYFDLRLLSAINPEPDPEQIMCTAREIGPVSDETIAEQNLRSVPKQEECLFVQS